MDELTINIRARYEDVLARMEVAAQRAGRRLADSRLVVVTKAQPLGVVEAAIQAGARILGENYPEEAVSKIQSLGKHSEVEWHMIGHVQSRKAQLVTEHFAFLHSLDSLKLAARLDRFAEQSGRPLPVLLEFNVSGEVSKYGWFAPHKQNWSQMLPEIGKLLELKHLEVRGLMTMPPFADQPEQSRPHFRKLRNLQSYLAGQFPQTDWHELSMGTSLDYEVAVEEGATLVRVGQAILGSRPV